MGVLRLCRWLTVFVFHPECIICGDPLVYPDESLLCRTCIDEIRPHSGAVCPRCGNFLSDATKLCGDCRLRPPPFESGRMFAAYEGVFREVILRYKYGGHLNLARFLARILPAPEKCKKDETVLVPVPEDPGRKRDYSPARELCRCYSRQYAIPMKWKAIRKIRTTPPQAGLSFAGRLNNLSGAFRVDSKRVAGKTVILVDDVVTTGSTVRACARSLKRAGATVHVVALARTP